MRRGRSHEASTDGASGLLERALGHSARGNYRRAEVCLREALKSAERRPGSFVVGRAALWNELGIVCKYLGKLDSAERYYRLSLRHAGRHPQSPERDFFLANLYHNLGGVEHSRRRFARAERYARRGLELRLKSAPRNSLAVASDQAALAAILDGLRRHDESRKYYFASLKIYRREYGTIHPEIAVILNNLGALYHIKGRTQQAKSYYRAALAMKRRIHKEKHPDVAVTMNNLALLYVLEDKKKIARQWFRKALRILDSTLGASHPNSRTVRQNQRHLG